VCKTYPYQLKLVLQLSYLPLFFTALLSSSLVSITSSTSSRSLLVLLLRFLRSLLLNLLLGLTDLCVEHFLFLLLILNLLLNILWKIKVTKQGIG